MILPEKNEQEALKRFKELLIQQFGLTQRIQLHSIENMFQQKLEK